MPITCAFCPATVPDVDAAILADWIPSYEVATATLGHYIEYSDPVCPRCQASRLYYDADDCPVLREKGKVPA